jgi:hypothetical protein
VFRITKRNVDAFVAQEELAFEARVVRRLRDNFDGMRGQSDEALIDFVRRGRARAARYDVRSPYAVSLYVGIMAELGEGFETSGAHAWALEVLNDEGLSGNAKVERISDRALKMETVTPGRTDG